VSNNQIFFSGNIKSIIPFNQKLYFSLESIS